MRDAVIMAAGQGTRLRPLTERWPKAVLPVDGRPVIGTLLRDLAEAGIAHAFVVTGHLAEQVEELVGDGSAFGLDVAYARQPGVLGSADAVQRGMAAGAEPPFVVAAADMVFARGDLVRFVERAAGADGALAVHRDARDRQGVRVEDGRVVRVVDRESTDFASAPLWAWGAALVPYLANLPGPPTELADACQRAIDDGVAIAAVEIGKTRDLTRPVDLVMENFSYLR